MALEGIDRYRGRVALVTGVSVGMGNAIARTLVENGLVVVGCARRKDKILELVKECEKMKYPGKLHAYQCDLTKAEEIEGMFEWAEKELGGVDIMVNNAAFTPEQTLLQVTAEVFREVLDTNLVAMALCGKLAIHGMRRRGVEDGQVVNINSLLGHCVCHFLHIYSGSKYGVTAITEGLRREVVALGSRIRVSVITPGFTNTDFLVRPYGEEKGRQLHTARNHMEAQDIADCLLYVISVPETTHVQEVFINPTGYSG